MYLESVPVDHLQFPGSYRAKVARFWTIDRRFYVSHPLDSRTIECSTKPLGYPTLRLLKRFNEPVLQQLREPTGTGPRGHQVNVTWRNVHMSNRKSSTPGKPPIKITPDYSLEKVRERIFPFWY